VDPENLTTAAHRNTKIRHTAITRHKIKQQITSEDFINNHGHDNVGNLVARFFLPSAMQNKAALQHSDRVDIITCFKSKMFAA
jgi:hypothetical protein